MFKGTTPPLQKGVCSLRVVLGFSGSASSHSVVPGCRIAAHGKKLNRNNVMKVNVVDTWYDSQLAYSSATIDIDSNQACLLRCSEQIINPEVPQALRLQGILIGNVSSEQTQQSWLCICLHKLLRLLPLLLQVELSSCSIVSNRTC